MIAVVIIPTYNEKDNIEKLLTVLHDEIFPQIKNYSMHALVVDDNSPDGTGEIVKNIMKKWKNVSLVQGEKNGLGAAYVRGMTYAVEKMKADVMFEFDADFSHDPYKIPEFLKKIDEGNDFVIGTRYSHGGSIPSNWGLHRKFMSVFGNLLVRFVMMRFYVHDWTGGYRAVKKEVFLKEKSKLEAIQGYTFQISFLHRAIQDGFKVAEVPFNFVDRTKGKSKIPSKETIIASLTYVFRERALELVKSPFLKYAVTGFLGYIINAVSLEYFADIVKLHPVWAAVIASELAVIWNFIVNNFWAFSKYKIDSVARLLLKFIQFNLVSAGSVIINSTIIFIATHTFGNTALVRQVALVIAIGFFVIPYSYSMYNIFIWKRWHIPFLSKFQKMAG